MSKEYNNEGYLRNHFNADDIRILTVFLDCGKKTYHYNKAQKVLTDDARYNVYERSLIGISMNYNEMIKKIMEYFNASFNNSVRADMMTIERDKKKTKKLTALDTLKELKRLDAMKPYRIGYDINNLRSFDFILTSECIDRLFRDKDGIIPRFINYILWLEIAPKNILENQIKMEPHLYIDKVNKILESLVDNKKKTMKKLIKELKKDKNSLKTKTAHEFLSFRYEKFDRKMNWKIKTFRKSTKDENDFSKFNLIRKGQIKLYGDNFDVSDISDILTTMLIYDKYEIDGPLFFLYLDNREYIIYYDGKDKRLVSRDQHSDDEHSLINYLTYFLTRLKNYEFDEMDKYELTINDIERRYDTSIKLVKDFMKVPDKTEHWIEIEQGMVNFGDLKYFMKDDLVEFYSKINNYTNLN